MNRPRLELPEAPWSFEFATAGRILFGDGVLKRVGAEAAAHGTRALVVHGNSGRGLPRLRYLLLKAGVESDGFAVPGEPEVGLAARGAALARELGATMVVGYGGGSAMDCAKAIAALATNPGDPLDYLEVVGAGKPLTHMPLPVLTIPTTAGTGSEVTRNAVLGVPEQRTKVSLRHPALLPRLALVDPTLTWDLPPDQTAASGLDALTQLIEAFLCATPNPLSDAVCRDGIARASRFLKAAWLSACDRSRELEESPELLSPHTAAESEARRQMSLSGTLSGLALANAKLGAVHGLAGPLGGMLHAPHGALCAALLPSIASANLAAASAVDAAPTRERFEELGRLLTGRAEATGADAVRWLGDLAAELEVPGLASWGLERADFPELIRAARTTSSMKGNPVPLSDEALSQALERAL